MRPAQVLRIVVGYVIVSALYIAFSDTLVHLLAPDGGLPYQLSVWKGFGFVAVTAAVLYWLLQRIRADEEIRYNALFNNHHAVMLLIEPETGAIVAANPAAEKFYGWPADRLRAMRISEINCLTPVEVRAEMARAEAMQSNVFHFRHRTAQAGDRDVEVFSGPIEVGGRRLLFSIVQDETALHRNERRLEAAELRWRYALEGAGHGVWEWNAQTNEVYYSPSWKAMLGYADDELGNTLAEWESRLHPDDRAGVEAEVQRHLRGETPAYRSEHRVRCKDGSYKWILDSGTVMTRTPEGKPLIVVGTHTDLTQRRLAEAALRDSERRYRTLFRDNPQPMWVYDPSTLRFLAVNEAMIAHYGYSEREFLGMTLLDIRPAEDVPRLLENIARGLPDGVRRSGAWRHRRKDGSLIDVEITSHGVEYDGRPARLVLVNDVTGRVQAERERASAEERFRMLAEQSLAGIYIIEDGKVAYANPRAAEIFGYAQAEVVGRDIADFIDPADLPLVMERVRRRLTGESETEQYEFRGRRKDGTDVLVGTAGTLGELGGRKVIMGVFQDVTAKARAEALARDYVVRLESALGGTVTAISRMMDMRDPYTAGHELRVGEISAAIAAELGLDEHAQRGLRVAGAVHDVGKITVPAEILSKPGRLTPTEFEIVKTHAQQGWEVLKDIDSPWPLAEVARQHHERMDGSGYPRGLKGEEILLEARILAVADVVESMGSHRPYRPTLGVEHALEEIESNAGRLYDPKVAAACLRLFREKGFRLPD